MKFNNTNLKDIRTDINRALSEVGEKYSIDIKAGRATYTSDTCDFKLKLISIGDDGVMFDEKAEDYKLYASNFGLDPDWFGKTFVSNENTFEITGLKTRRNLKYRVLAKNLDNGKPYKFADYTVIRKMQAQEQK